MTTEGPAGSVLEHEFCTNPKTYFTTSYPHPIEEAAKTDFRKKRYSSVGLPRSLTRKLREKISREEGPGGRAVYIMNLSTYKPTNKPDWNTELRQDPPGYIWFMYSYHGKAASGDFNNPGRLDPIGDLSTSFGVRARSLLRQGDGIQISYAAFGPSSAIIPQCFFLRGTNMYSAWHYRWDVLPALCETTVQEHLQGGRALATSQHTWPNGHLRAVEFGFGGSWVIYTTKKFYWHGQLPRKLRAALEEGEDNEWTINKISLNSRNPYEYVLAFNEGQVHYSMHKDYIADFEEVLEEWAERKRDLPPSEYKRFPTILDDTLCHNNHDPENLDAATFGERNHVRHPSGRSTDYTNPTASGADSTSDAGKNIDNNMDSQPPAGSQPSPTPVTAPSAPAYRADRPQNVSPRKSEPFRERFKNVTRRLSGKPTQD